MNKMKDAHYYNENILNMTLGTVLQSEFSDCFLLFPCKYDTFTYINIIGVSLTNKCLLIH